MTRSSPEKIDLLSSTSANLSATRKMLKAMGLPMATIRKLDDALDAINYIMKAMRGDE